MKQGGVITSLFLIKLFYKNNNQFYNLSMNEITQLLNNSNKINIENLKDLIINKNLRLSYDGYTLNKNINIKTIDILNMLIEYDDNDLFELFSNTWNRNEKEIGFFKDTSIINKIIKSTNIFNNLLNTKIVILNIKNKNNKIEKGVFLNPLLRYIACYLFSNNITISKVNKLLNFGIIHNKKVINNLNLYFKNNNLKINNNGLIFYNDKLISSTIYFKFISQPDIDESCYKLLSKCNEIIDSYYFYIKEINNGFSNSSVILKDNLIKKKTTNNSFEYQFLNLFNSKNISFIPKLIKQRNGYDYFEYIDGYVYKYVKKMNFKKIESIVLKIKTMNEISKEYFHSLKVFVHNDLSILNVVFNNDEVKAIIDFDSIKIGEEYEDLIYIMWTWLNIGDIKRNDEEILLGIKKILDIYQADSTLKFNWSDKMIEVMENRLLNASPIQNDYKRIKTWVKDSESFIYKYRDFIKKEIG